MKRHVRLSRLHKAAGSLLLAALAVGSFPVHAGEEAFVNSTFNTDAAGWYWENWSQAGSSAGFEANQNSTFSGGPTPSGSLKLVSAFGSSGYQQAVFTKQLPAPRNFNSLVGAISFDVKVDAASTPKAEGDYGFLEVILRQGSNWDWVGLPGIRLRGNEWQRVVFNVPKSGVDLIQAITVKLGDNDLLGPVTLYIDNIDYTVDPDDNVIWSGNQGVVTDPTVGPPTGWSWENWSQAGSTVAAEALDFYGRPTSGSLTLSNNFSNPSGYSQAVYTFVLPATVNAIEEFSHINLDVKVDPISTPRTGGDFGFFEIILRNGNNWDWVATGPSSTSGTRLTGTDWQHISMPLRGGDAVHRITLKLGDNNLPGPVVLHVDNITWTRSDAPPPPPTLSISEVTDKGFYLVHTSSDQYGRHSIRTLTDEATIDTMSFVDKTAPMTYSFDILSFPSNPPNDGFQAHIFLAPGPSSDTIPDWSAPTMIFLDIKANTTGGGNATFRWKTNQPAANGADANGHGLYVAGLSNLTATTIVGTWGITVTDKTNFTVTGPGGASMTVPLPLEVVNKFYSDAEMTLAQLHVFFGVQGNQPKNIGQRARIGRAGVKEGATVLVEDAFPGPELDLEKWAVAGPPAGIQFVSENLFLIGWSLPDSGFNTWEYATTLTSPTWTPVDLSAFTPLQLGPAKKQISVKASELPQLQAGQTQFYLRLVKPL